MINAGAIASQAKERKDGAPRYGVIRIENWDLQPASSYCLKLALKIEHCQTSDAA
jgi:hypothetical protein